ncbi:TVP38/TMEM64 family protein, partial [Pseudomonas sp. HMWF031]
SLLAGALLGFQTGFIVIVIADLLFCETAFLLARSYGREPIKRLVGNQAMAKVEGFSRHQLEGNPFLLTGLLMTGLFDFVSYAAGLGGTSWRGFSLPLLVSVLLSDAPIVALGAGIFSGGKLLLGAALLGVFALALIAGVVKQRARRQAESAS